MHSNCRRHAAYVSCFACCKGSSGNMTTDPMISSPKEVGGESFVLQSSARLDSQRDSADATTS